jgi:uncharacterized protein YjbI with pentapeptide repeats
MNSPAIQHVLAALLFVSTAHAACHDPAGPGVDWSGCRVKDGLQLSGKAMTGANFSGSTVRFTDMSGADLSQSSFVGSKHILNKLQGAKLQGTNLTDGVFYLTDFTNADLRGATFSRASLIEVKLAGALLTGAKWLDGSKICAEGSIGVCK